MPASPRSGNDRGFGGRRPLPASRIGYVTVTYSPATMAWPCTMLLELARPELSYSEIGPRMRMVVGIGVLIEVAVGGTGVLVDAGPVDGLIGVMVTGRHA